MTTLHEALQKIADALPAYIDGVAAREYLRVVHAALAQGEPVAKVAEIHMSRYTLEWVNGPLPEGTELYAAAAPAAQQGGE